MGEITIRFRMNMATGKKDIVIEYESDEDLMRHEHEREHRRIVEQLVGQGLLEAGEAGEVRVERAAPGLLAPDARQEPARPEGQAEASSG